MPEDTTKELDITTVARGAAPELFAHGLKEILANIKDPNTATKAKREIILKFTFEPHEDREDTRSEMVTYVEMKVKHAPVVPVASFAFISRRGNEITASVNDVQQGDPLKPDSGVVPMRQPAS